MCGEVFLIGAGCGEYDLITLRGIKHLQNCDTVIYDALIDERLLSYVPRDAERIYAGKRSGGHSMAQDDINALIVAKALEGKRVARLKGGDPFVFGRATEEITELIRYDIPYTVIPGISSSIAVPELAGIPVTSRKESRSFHVITAHTAENTTADDFSRYASLGGTLVFLMGLGKLDLITQGLILGGINKDTPAAVISNGATNRQVTVRGTVESIAEKAAPENIPSPAVIVIGTTARYSFTGTIKFPLGGMTITAAGTEHFTSKIRALAEEKGAAVSEIVNIETKHINTPLLDEKLHSLSVYGIIALMSIHGAEIFLERLKALHIDIRQLRGIRIATVGSETAAYLAERGIFPDIVPDRFDSLGLGEKLIAEIAENEKVLILDAVRANTALTDILGENDIIYDNIKIYDTVKIKGDAVCVTDDHIVFGSSSGVEAFFETGSVISVKTVPVCIGEPTANTLRKYYAGDIITAQQHCADGIITAMIDNTKR